MVRFLQSADLQLGMPFESFGERARSWLRERRLEVIDRIGEVVRDASCEFVVLAGDVFDANDVDDATVRNACLRLRRLGVPVVILPGNHDAGGGPYSVYRRDSFRQEAGDDDRILVADTPDPLVLLDGRALILPAPLTRRHVVGDPTAWMTEESGTDLAPDAVRIGLAHGSVQGFGAEGDALNRVDPAVLGRARLDWLALGDWHGLKEIGPRVWYSGTPEPTAFKENDSGRVLVVEIAAPGAAPSVDPVRVGRTRWLRHEARLVETGDLDRLEQWIESIDEPLETLVRLELSGSLGLHDMDRLEQLLERAAQILVHLRIRGPGVLPEAAPEEIESIAVEGWVRIAVERLLESSRASDEAALDAKRALQILYRLQREGGGR